MTYLSPQDDRRLAPDGAAPNFDLAALYAEREAERFDLHSTHLNEMWVRVLKTIGYDVGFVRGAGQYLYRPQGRALSRSAERLGRVRDRPQPSVAARGADERARRRSSQSRAARRLGAGGAARRAAARLSRPGWTKIFFANSGTEAVEAAIKFARAATGRDGLVHCAHSFHGLTCGALVAQWRRDLQEGLRLAAAECARDSLRRSSGARGRSARTRRRGLLRRADSGQGRQHSARRLSRRGGGALPQIRDAARRRRNSDRPRPHR